MIAIITPEIPDVITVDKEALIVLESSLMIWYDKAPPVDFSDSAKTCFASFTIFITLPSSRFVMSTTTTFSFPSETITSSSG